MATTPMSPNMCSSWWVTHQRIMVPRVTSVMNHWIPVNLSLTGRIGTIVVPLPGLKVTRRSTQIRRMEIIPTGMTTKNHAAQEGLGSMFWRAMMFCGEAIGESMPPMFEARAIPRMRALDIWESEGRLRSMGFDC